jgi:ParB/RepB/Spo0J family partition protein
MLQELRIEEILPNPDQPRKHFDEGALKELADSIQSDGLQEPILVRPKDGKYEIVRGERRYRAHIIAGLQAINVKVRELNDDDAFHLSVIENIQREQLTPIEEANAFLKYVEKGFTHEQIAKKVSKTRTFITTRLRLLKLIPILQEWISKGFINEGHAKQILKMEPIIERLWAGKSPTYDSHFGDFQWKFYGSFWYQESKGEKITVLDVQKWADSWRYAHINAVVKHYVGKSEEIISFERSLPITAELECCIWGLVITKITEEDIDFANKYELKLFKNDFNKDFRPWMIDGFWDDVRQDFFYGGAKVGNWVEPRGIKILSEDAKQLRDIFSKKELDSKSLDEIAAEIKDHEARLNASAGEISKKTGKSVDDVLMEVLADVSCDTMQ